MSRLSPRLTFSALLIAFFSVACSSASKVSVETNYVPVLSTRAHPATRAARGTLKGDFEWAADSFSLNEAVFRWGKFLKAHDPHDGEYGDGFHKLHVDAAKYELMRVYYLLGRIDDGDRLLKQIDPLTLDHYRGTK